MTNDSLQTLARRLRTKAALLLDADIEFAHDLLMASYALDDLRCTRHAVDAMLAEATSGVAAMHTALTFAGEFARRLHGALVRR